MTRKEFKQFIVTKLTNHVKKLVTPDLSVTDPSFARTGRQMIFQPLPIEYRMKYPEGVPLNKETPLEFNEYDKLYPDQFKAMTQARKDINTTKDNLNKIKAHEEKLKQQQQNNE